MTASAPDKPPKPALPLGTLVRVRANQPSFHEVNFTPGFNVVLAERTKDSTRKDSRNGLGKSTLIEIVSFCLGSQPRKGQGLLINALWEWAFTLDMSLGGRPVSVTRRVWEPNKILVSGDVSGWPFHPSSDPDSGQSVFKLAEWNALLGLLLIDIPVDGFDCKYAPTYRSLISYCIRRGKDAYSSPFEHFRKQQEWDKQVNNAFLLDLAWKDASDWQGLKDKKAILQGLNKAIESDLMAEVMQGSLGELEASQIRLEREVKEQSEALKSFAVLPQYHEMEEKANRLSREISRAANTIVTDRQLLESYEASLAETQEPNVDEVVAVYEEAGVFFPDKIRKRLEEVIAFHHQLIDNRRRFLASEIERLRQSIEKADALQRDLIGQRASLLTTLKSHGALEEYTQLQEMHSARVAQLKAVQARIENLRRLEEGKGNVRIEKELLKRRTRNDLDDRKPQREKAISLFNANSEALYESPANLVIDVGPSGFRFDVEILRSASGGVGNMKILCYDLMLAELWAKKDRTPRFLVHDSVLFDGVDERQIAHGLELAARKSRECGFQYICVLNSDMIPSKDFSTGFDLNSYVRLILTDKDPTGSLLGIRF